MTIGVARPSVHTAIEQAVAHSFVQLHALLAEHGIHGIVGQIALAGAQHIRPGRDEEDGAGQLFALVTEPQHEAQGQVAAG